MTCFFVVEGLRRIAMINATVQKAIHQVCLDKSSTSSNEEKVVMMGSRSYRLELWYGLKQSAAVNYLRDLS